MKILSSVSSFLESKRTNSRLRLDWDFLLGFVLSFFLGRTVLVGSLTPFAPAIYAGVRSAGGAFSTVMGIASLLGSATLGRWDLTGYHAIGILLVTLLIKPVKGRKSMALVDAALCGGIVAASRAAVVMIVGPTLLAYLAAFLEGLCALVVCLLAANAFPEPKPLVLTEKRSDALLVLVILALGGLGDITLAGLRVQTVVVMGCTLIAAYIGGPGAGAMAGLSGGLMLSLTAGEEPVIFGLLGVAGLLAGIGGWFGQVEAILGYLASGLLVSLYAASGAIVTRRFLEQAIACLFIIIVNSRVSKRLSSMFPMLSFNSHAVKPVRLDVDPHKLRTAAVSHALAEVGSLFAQAAASSAVRDTQLSAAQTATPTVPGSQEIITHVAERVCRGCEQRSHCWETNFGPTFESFVALLRKMAITGRLTSDDNRSGLVDKCQRFGEVVAELNHWEEIGRLERRIRTLDDETKECLAFQYRCLGHMLAPARPSEEGDRRPKPKLKLTIKGGTVAAEGAAKAGDMWAQYQLQSGKTLVVLSDGMGKGEAAFRQSKETLDLMKSLLDCGLDYDSCVSFLNSALFLACRPDSFVAIDCLLIDQETERAYFHKFGAPPSFIRKGDGNVLVVRGTRPPAGALNIVPCLATSEPVSPGDCILLVSDGIFRSSPVPARAEHLVVSRLRRQKDGPLDATIKSLLAQGQRPGGGDPPDDVTVVGILVEKV